MSVEIHRGYQPTSAAENLRGWADEARAAAAIAQSLAPTPFIPESLRYRDSNDLEVPERTVTNVTAALLTGQELGLAPMAAMRSIDVIEGTPALRALALRALVVQAGHEIWVVESNKSRCIMSGRRRGSDHIQQSVWTIDRAKDLGLAERKNWRKQPTSMLLARATAEVARLIAPDALLGLPYIAEEIDDEMAIGATDEPTPVKAAPRRRAQRAPIKPTAAEPSTEETKPDTPPRAVPDDEPSTDEPAPPADTPPTDEPTPKQEEHRPIMGLQMRALHAGFGDIGITSRTDKLAFLSEVIGREITTTKDLTVAEASHALNALAERREQRPLEEPSTED